MADGSTGSGSSGSAVLLSAVAGAVLGAAGLAWWLVVRREARRLKQRQQRHLSLSRLQDGSPDLEAGDGGRCLRAATEPAPDDPLHAKVHQLNQAIDDVRRQLEQLQPQS